MATTGKWRRRWSSPWSPRKGPSPRHYRLLNDLPALAGRNPTAELLAENAFLHLQAAALRPCWVKVREKNNYWALCRAGAGR